MSCAAVGWLVPRLLLLLLRRWFRLLPREYVAFGGHQSVLWLRPRANSFTFSIEVGTTAATTAPTATTSRPAAAGRNGISIGVGAAGLLAGLVVGL